MLINYLRCAHVLCIECDLSNQRISGEKNERKFVRNVSCSKLEKVGY